MADEVKVEEQVVAVPAPTVNPFSDESWAENTPIVNEEKKEEVKVESIVTEVKKEEDEVVDADVYLKTTLGYDSWAAAKEEIESLKKLKAEAQTKEELKFINEQSKKLYEAIKEGKDDVVYEMLDTKRKLSTVANLSSADILKLHIEQTNKHYKQADVQDVFEEKYAYPEKPSEDDIDYDTNIVKYNEAVEKINRRIERDSVTAKEDLAKLNTELTLPDITKETDPKLTPEAQQKELERIEEVRNQYLKVLESDYSKFNGYEVRLKDGEVEIPITYGVAENEKVAMRDEFKDFDVDGFIGSRWFNKDGAPNITQMMEDVHLLRNKGDVFQKIANEAGSKRLEYHLKTKSNIDLNKNGADKTFVPTDEKPGQNAMADFFWSQS